MYRVGSFVIALGIGMTLTLTASAQGPQPRPSSCDETLANYAQIVANQTKQLNEMSRALEEKSVEIAKLKPKDDSKKPADGKK